MSVYLAIHPSKEIQLHKSLNNKYIKIITKITVITKINPGKNPQPLSWVLINVPILRCYGCKRSPSYKRSLSASVTKHITVIQQRWKEQGVPGDRLHREALHHTVKVSPFGFCSISCDSMSTWGKTSRKAKQNSLNRDVNLKYLQYSLEFMWIL